MSIATAAPPATVSLTSLREATTDYLRDSVTTTVSNVTGNLEVGDEGTFDLRVVNATTDTGVRLEEVVLHLSSTNADVITLMPPGSALLTPRAINSSSAPRLSTNDRVEEYFLFFTAADFTPNSILEPGESIDLDLGFEAAGAGTTEITCHLHATVDVVSLFPRGNGRNGRGSVSIRS